MEEKLQYTDPFEQRSARKRKGTPLRVLFFPGVILYGELLLRAFSKQTLFLSLGLLRITLFSVAAGLLLYLILDLLPWPRLARTLAGLLFFLGGIYICVAHCCEYFFGTYYAVGYMAQMTGGVMGDFSGTMGEVIVHNLLFIFLALLPTIIFLFLRTRFFCRWSGNRLVLLILLVLFQAAGSTVSAAGNAKSVYTYDYQANTSIQEFGALTTLRLELQYWIIGIPEAPLEKIELPTVLPEETQETTLEALESTEGTEPDETTEATEPEPVYGYNTLSIDFEALKQSASSDTVLAMHEYFSSLTPSQENEYTGLFEGKNLILITAEAFCPYVISETLTPTLYKLANESFVFTNYYQPDWNQSTAGGEFAVLTGLIPTWQGSNLALKASAGISMPYTLGWAFQTRGYSSLAYHNNTYTYYDRHKSHPNMGYNWTAVGNGLVLESSSWPNSDLEMMVSTVDTYIQDYVENGKSFHAYYMTVSGHANYNWGGNNMSYKNKQAAQEAYPNASDAVQAYIACNLELEAAMAYLMEKLEAAGIADDTVIVLTADHYPYALSEDKTDYYLELSGVEDTTKDTSRYKNSLILWCGSMEETVVVDTPCSSIDIVPTLNNLFGIEYDSRLYSGRDVFAANYDIAQPSTCMPLVVFPAGNTYSWITAAGTYNAWTGTFTPNAGVTVGEDYVAVVSQLVKAKTSYAKQILQQDYYGIIKASLS